MIGLKHSSENPKASKDGALIPAHQSLITAGSDAHINLPCTPAPPTNSLGSGNTIYFDIERD